MGMIRLDKYLANAGCGTRSEVKALLKKGQITVNGIIEKKGDRKINDTQDQILCAGTQTASRGIVWLMLNKPEGYLSATEDRHGKTVLELLPEKERFDLFPVGRLDIDTEGLLLLTNDGAAAHHLLSPKHHVDKQYLAVVSGIITPEDISVFQNGMEIGEKRLTRPALLQVLTPENSLYLDEQEWRMKQRASQASFITEFTETLVTIHEGKYHQIKRMFSSLGKEVLYLKRLSMGSVVLDSALQTGAYRRLTMDEQKGLYEC